MSGISGICESGAQLHSMHLQPMLGGLVLAHERPCQVLTELGAVFGVSPRWDFQSVASRNGVLATVSADLCNLKDLSAEITSAGSRKAVSVAELIAEMYCLSGLKFLDKLEGSFSVALWDSVRQELVLAVDRLGLETLYWAQGSGRIWFASRVGAIARANADCELNPAALVQFLLYTVVPAPMTIYHNVERMEPGTILRWDPRGNVIRHRYWDLDYEESADRNAAFWAEQLRAQMRQAVQSHLDGCRTVHSGTYLSGGTDSSSVLAFASEIQNPINTFSIYFENPRYDEIGFARIAADTFHARHYEKCLQASDAVHAIPSMIDYFDEPFANSSALGAYHCARLAAENRIELLLAGDGGDELFAGNERYAADKKFALYNSVPALIRRCVLSPLAQMLPREGMLSLPARYIRRAEMPNPHRILSYSFFLSQVAEQIFDRDLLRETQRDTWLSIAESHFNAAPHASSELNRLLYVDVKMTLADNDIRKVKGTAEMAGVKVRFPLLDHHLAELSGRIPSTLKLRGFQKRFIFKEAMKGILPDAILYKKKHGFGVPVGYWILHDPEMRTLAAVLDEPQARQRGYFRPDFLSRIKRLNESYPAYYGEVVWVLLMLELWHRRHYKSSDASRCEMGIVHGS